MVGDEVAARKIVECVTPTGREIEGVGADAVGVGVGELRDDVMAEPREKSGVVSVSRATHQREGRGSID